MSIRKLKDGTYKATGENFNVVKMEPNLRRNMKTFMELDEDEGFLKRLCFNHPKTIKRKVKLKVKKSGGCWKVRCADTDKLIMIHDLEFDKARLKR